MRRWKVTLFVGDDYTEVKAAVQHGNEVQHEGVVNLIHNQLVNSTPLNHRWVRLADGREGTTMWRAEDIKGYDVVEVDPPGTPSEPAQ